MLFSYLMQGDNIIFNIDGKSHVVNKKTHLNYDEIMKAFGEEDYETVASLVDTNRTIATYANGDVEIKNGTVTYKGREVHGSLVKRMIEMYRRKLPINPLVNFLKNVMENPSSRSVRGLYDFLERNKLPITPDGCFYGYKRVKEDYTDCYTGKINNKVGQLVRMPRNEVDDEPRRTCSHGLHVCAIEYLQSSGFGGKGPIMICKINPKDVVAFPDDYNFSKARVCEYLVVAEHGTDEKKEAFSSPVESITVNLPESDGQSEIKSE